MADNPIVLVLNCGSSSLKFALINANSGKNLLTGLAECLGLEGAEISWKVDGEKTSKPLGANAMHDEALASIVELVNSQDSWSQGLVAVGHRVVHGGEKFTSSVLITEDVINSINDVASLAPLHNPANITGIRAAITNFSHLPQVAVFDTAFHQTMPQTSYIYALPYKYYRDNGVRRYGFHGTSHRYVADQAADMLGKPIESCNLITAHLGNGASVCAIKDGQCVDTSTGLTPLEGLVMGTRSGDMDPGIYQYLMSELNLSGEEVNTILNKKSGLLGISELSNDCRELEQAAESGNQQAELALAIFSYRLAKYIASYMVPIGTLDALIFTGGIGENSASIRERVVSQLGFLNMELDTGANLQQRFGNAGPIGIANTTTMFVIPTNEELVIAQDTFSLIS